MDDKTKLAFELFGQGKTYREIGEAIGLSRQRAQQIVRPPKAIYDCVRERAGGKCEQCNKEEIKGHVHHKEKEGAFNELSKLEYLCISCHTLQHPKLNKPKLPKVKRVLTPEEIEARRLKCVESGKKSAGKPKNYSPEEREKRRQRIAIFRQRSWQWQKKNGNNPCQVAP